MGLAKHINLFVRKSMGKRYISSMSVEQIAESLLSLGLDERRRFFHWLYEHEGELLGEEEDIHPAAKAEILLRLTEVEENPELLQPWDGSMKPPAKCLMNFVVNKSQFVRA
jgi:hypothetical protein